MNMSEDVAGATIQVTSKVAEVGSHAVTKVIDLIAKLFDAWMSVKRSSAAAKSQKVKSTDLTNIKPGAVSLKSLVQSAKAGGDQVVFSEQGITKSDQKYIAEKARQFGIPVAFVQADGKDNIFVQVRKSDLPVFQKICTDRMKDKLAERPQTLGNFKVQAWEMPFLTNELNHYDLAASFGVTRDGERFCLYEKADEKAILIAREEFHRKCEDIEQDLSFSKGEDGFYTLRSSGNDSEISFDELPSREELATQIGERFGYDANKSEIACAKFAEEMLHGEDKMRFFSEDPQQEFSCISGNISVEGEDVRCKAYTCWRVTPKADEMPRIVFRDTDGKFAVLSPETQSAKQMQAVLRESLGVEDTATLAALTDKAQKVSDNFILQEQMTLDADFDRRSFDMTDPAVVEGMRRTNADGLVLTKTQPVDSVHNEIERTGKDTFTVKSAVNATEFDENGTEYRSTDSQQLILTFSDKKNAIAELKDLYKAQGIPDHAAIAMAKDVFARAKAQPPERIVLLEEVRAETIKVSYGGRTAHIPVADRDRAVTDICGKFGVSKEVAEQVLSRSAQHQIAAPQAAGRTIEAARQNIAAHQAHKMDFHSALDRMTDRETLARDSVILCSAANPQNYIKCTGEHNSERVVHQYDVYRDGLQQQAADRFGTGGVFTDEHSKGADGKAVRVTLENGKNTSYWSALKQDMKEKSGIGEEPVLVFESQEEFERYREDSAMVERVEALASAKDIAPEIPDTSKLDAPKIEVPKPRSRH